MPTPPTIGFRPSTVTGGELVSALLDQLYLLRPVFVVAHVANVGVSY